MKTTITAVVIIVMMGVAVSYRNSDPISYVKEKTTEVVQVEVIPDWMKIEDEDAKKAYQDVIRKKELQKESGDLKSQIDELQKRKAEVDKELGTFWRELSNVKALIRQAFPEDPHTAVAVATCESGLQPNAYNGNNSNGSTDGGLWQINSTHDKRLEELGLDKYNPEDATKFARILYDESGWRPWVCAWHKDHLAMNIR